jgi:tRNA(fMet)-specific endonuclease VapC
MVCLDTSFLVDILRGREIVVELKEEFDRRNEVLAIATPSIIELWSGALKSKASAAEKAKTDELIQSLEVLPLDLNAAKDAAEIEAGLLSKGTAISATDIMIAAIARVNCEKVVTRDEHFTRIPGLVVIKY